MSRNGRDTDIESLRPVMDAIDELERTVEHETSTVKKALQALRQMCVEHYHAIQARVDDHAKRIGRIEERLSLPPMDGE